MSRKNQVILAEEKHGWRFEAWQGEDVSVQPGLGLPIFADCEMGSQP